MKKHKKLILIASTGIIISITSINLYINIYSQNYISETPSQKYYTGILLGAGVKNDGALSLVLKDRVDKTIELYENGSIKKILVSGDHGRKNYDEVNAIKKYLIKHQIPDSIIFLDHAGFDTYDTMLRAQKVFRVDNAIIISQEFHLARALYIARRIGIDAEAVIANKYKLNKWLILKLNCREVISKCKAFLDVEILLSDPKFLGEEISITGNGYKSFD